MRLLFILLSALVLAACQSVQYQSIPLDSNFLAQAEVFELKRPTWRLTDKVFHQQAGRLSISAAAVATPEQERSQLWFRESGFRIDGIVIEDKFLRFIFLDLLDLGKKTQQQFRLNSERDFRFALTLDGKHTVDSRCRMLALEDQLVVERASINAKATTPSISTFTQRQHSYLGCELTQGDTSWRLLLDVDSNSKARLELSKTLASPEHVQAQEYGFEPVTDTLYLVDNQWRQVPATASLGLTMTGFSILQNSEKIAALSFDGNLPKIWIKQQLAPEQQALMAAASYSVLMSDWLDAKWRVTLRRNGVGSPR